jgi:hypothetical protein
MKPKDLILRCYAARETDGSWYGICLDLNLFAQADTVEDVQTKLHAMIKDYTREAFTEDKQFISSLIPRKAPFSFFARYYFASVFSLFHRMKNTRTFNDPLPLVPA